LCGGEFDIISDRPTRLFLVFPKYHVLRN